MYNLYQSKLRKDINEKIYKKPHFYIDIFGKQYFWLIKTKARWPFKIQRYQVMWIELPDDEEYIKAELARIKKEYSQKKSNILFQFGFINEIIRFENIGTRTEDFKNDMKQIRLNIRDFISSKFDLKVSFRENMPQSNIIYYIENKTDKEFIEQMNSGCQNRVKRAIKKWLYFGMATPDRYDLFYQKWAETVWTKWINIISKDAYYDLLRYLTQNNRWNLFISLLDWEIVSGSICLYDEHRIIYLYGFASRKFGNIWWHHFLKFKLFARARDNWFTYCDMLWWAPTWFPEHPLTSVSAFKESLWWMKIELYGSYDMILNKILYKLFSWYTQYREK
jgi:hypothetical protein